MTDDNDVTAPNHEDPAAMHDYQAHLAEVEHDRVVETLADSLARGMFADLRAEDGNPDGEHVVSTFAVEMTRPFAKHILADPRFTISLANAS